MIDYTEFTLRLQKALAEQSRLHQDTLNIPGVSLACKIDPYYYLAVHPSFVARLANWGATTREKVRTSLVKTGNLVLGRDGSDHLSLSLVWEGPGVQRAKMNVSILHSSFIDRALVMYAGVGDPPVSDLRIDKSEQEKLETFLSGKTLIEKLAYFTG